MKEAIEKTNGSLFKGRELRIKRAIDPKRLEKKQRKRLEKTGRHFSNVNKKQMEEDELNQDEATSSFLKTATTLTNNDESIKLENIRGMKKRLEQKKLKEIAESLRKKGTYESKTQKHKNGIFKE